MLLADLKAMTTFTIQVIRVSTFFISASFSVTMRGSKEVQASKWHAWVWVVGLKGRMYNVQSFIVESSISYAPDKRKWVAFGSAQATTNLYVGQGTWSFYLLPVFLTSTLSAMLLCNVEGEFVTTKETALYPHVRSDPLEYFAQPSLLIIGTSRQNEVKRS